MNFKDETGFGKWLRLNGWGYIIEGSSDYYTSYGTTSICYTFEDKWIRIGLIGQESGARIGLVHFNIFNYDAPRPLKYTYLPEADSYKHYMNVLLGTEAPIWD